MTPVSFALIGVSVLLVVSLIRFYKATETINRYKIATQKTSIEIDSIKNDVEYWRKKFYSLNEGVVLSRFQIMKVFQHILSDPWFNKRKIEGNFTKKDMDHIQNAVNAFNQNVGNKIAGVERLDLMSVVGKKPIFKDGECVFTLLEVEVIKR